MEFLDIISSAWAIRAIVASSMVGIMCGVIGCFIVLRNMSLIGDALSHAILPGIFVAFLLVGYSTVGFFTGSVIAGLLAALMITWIQQNIATKNDAAIGIVFTAMFSIGVIGISWLSKDRGAHLDLKDFLFGNVLGISNSDLILTFFILLYTLISIAVLFRYLTITTFQPVIAKTMGISVKAIHYFLMLLLSFAVVSALRTVGVILVVAMLITPASTALLLSDRLQKVLVLSGLIGLASAMGGMMLAIFFDTTPGPAMVIFATSIYFGVAVFAPKKGFLTRFFLTRAQNRKIEMEDVVKHIFKNNENTVVTPSSMIQRLDFSPQKMNGILKRLLKEDIIVHQDNRFILTQKGKDMALRLIRAHRLWESYQVETMGLTKEQIHEEAEIFEHLLSEELLDEVDAKLGYPAEDPHGSPIPPKNIIHTWSLLAQKPRSKSRVLPEQQDIEVEGELWELGIMPSTIVQVVENAGQMIKLKAGNKLVEMDRSIANRVRVQPIR